MITAVAAGTNQRRDSLTFPVGKRPETPCAMASLAITIPTETSPSFACLRRVEWARSKPLPQGPSRVAVARAAPALGIEFAGLDKRGNGRPVLGPGIVFGKECILAIEGNRPNGALDTIVVDLDAFVGQEELQSIPVFGDVGQCLAERRLSCGKLPVRPSARHAGLAVNIAGAVTTFLVETHEA